ncbi:MAG: hypothetical protein FWE98_01395 [Oscillospiraceae bacterium]|nr:hypothetical protein [Oscillospiraceae bacterium]
MKRLLYLAAALLLLGACGVQVTPEETTTPTTEITTTTQVIVPQLSPEQAEKIVTDFIGEKSHHLGIEARDITDDGQYYIVAANCIWYSEGVLWRGGYCVDVITGDLYGPNEHRGESIGASLPLKNLKYLDRTGEEYDAAELTAKSLFPDLHPEIYRFVQREGRTYCIYAVIDIVKHECDFVYRDLATQELFLWNLDTDTLTPYSPA